MTTSRSKEGMSWSLAHSRAGLAVVAGLALLLLVLPPLLRPAEPPTRPIRAIVGSDLRGEAINDALLDRVDQLSRDKAGMSREFREAGFALDPFPGGQCWRWTLSVAPRAPDEALRGFLHLCDDGGEVIPRRLAIGRGPAYD
jgi:hypothetical protein